MSVSNVECFNINASVGLFFLSFYSVSQTQFLLSDFVAELQPGAGLLGLLKGGERGLVAAHVLRRLPHPVVVQHLQYRNMLRPVGVLQKSHGRKGSREVQNSGGERPGN